jgi:hypothetical protein
MEGLLEGDAGRGVPLLSEYAARVRFKLPPGVW